jgi:hypothetical protein
MRRAWSVVGTVVVSCVLAGCGDGGGEATATPDNLDAARDAAKKMRLREIAAAEKNKQKSAEAPKGAAEAAESKKKTGGE